MSRPRSPSSPRDGDDDPTPPRGNQRTGRRAAGTDAPADGDIQDWDEEWEEPNYLIRRALVVAGVVVSIAVLAIGASRFVGGDDGGGSDSSGDAAWNTTVVLARDEIRLLDRESGELVDTFDAAVNLLDAQSLVTGDVLVTMTNRGAIELIDLDDGSGVRGRSGLDETLIASPDNPRIAIAGPDSGGDLTIIDIVGREVFGVSDVAGLTDPLIFTGDIRVNPSGSHVAVPVPNAFQSFVIDVAEQTSTAYAGRVIAISDDLIVTEQPAGPQSEIEFHEIAGDRLASVDVPAPRASLLTADGSLLLVAVDGSVRTVDSEGTVDDADPITDNDGAAISVTNGFAALGGTRLVVSADDTIVILDEEGALLATTPGRVAGTSSRALRCVIVGSGRSNDPSTVMDLEDGSVITTIDGGIAASASVDGCTVALVGATDNLLTDGRVVEIDARSIAEVAPDGDVVVVLDGRYTELVRVGDEDQDDGDPIEIADEPIVVRFGQRE